MGFTAGMSASMVMGTPSYYIDSVSNQWDAHTWVNIHFDSSGSMNDIITPLQNSMTGAYFSSGSAAGKDGVKSTTSLRAELQDLYATGGIEGAPNYNANNATNGKNAYDLRVYGRSINDENWLTWSNKFYNASNPSGISWTTLGNTYTINHIIEVFVINESKGGAGTNLRGAGYYSTGWAEPQTGTVTKTVASATTNSTTVTLNNVTDIVQESANKDANNVSEPFAEHMKLTAVSTGSLSGTPTITGISSNTITLSSAQTFAQGTELTFSMTSKGFNTTSGSFHHSSPDDHATYNTAIALQRTLLSSSSSGNLKSILTNSSQKPSITYIVIDAGTGNSVKISGLGNTAPGIVASGHNGPGGITASQRHTKEGVIEGKLTFNDTRTDGNNKSLSDFTDLTSWNEKSNMLHLVALTNKSAETSQAYWKDQLRAALQLNVSF